MPSTIPLWVASKDPHFRDWYVRLCKLDEDESLTAGERLLHLGDLFEERYCVEERLERGELL